MKKSLLVLALLFSLVSFAQSPADKSFPPEELFALGSYYYPEQWDSSQWERDLKKMSEMGIKFTHFAEFAWAMMEPEEGKYDFEWLDRGGGDCFSREIWSEGNYVYSYSHTSRLAVKKVPRHTDSAG